MKPGKKWAARLNKMRQITVYKYNELPTEKAKEKARVWFAIIANEYEFLEDGTIY